MQEIDDPLLQERMHDLEDLSNRLLRIVSGRMGTAAQTGLTRDAVLIARNLGPADLLEYDRRRLKAVLLEEGSLTSHMTIVARAIGIPVLGRLHDIRHSVQEGETILVDGDSGSVIIRPNRQLVAGFEHRMGLSQRRRAEFAAVRTLPAKTRDGVHVSVMVNAGLAEDAASLDMTGADGIGLFRTEFQFLVSATLPGRERQQRLYSKVLESAGNKPVVFRTVDIGGDKALPYLSDDAEEKAENPAMGWRALRLSLDRSALMRAQSRALIEASGGKVLRVMFPMISEPWEYEQARALFEEQVEWARKAKRRVPKEILFGAMVEVPSLAEMLDQLLPRVDFLSIGTNDLTQFLFAADRSDPRLAHRYDWLSPAILRFVKRILVSARAADVPVRVCGEMAGRPLEAMALVGIRRRELLDYSGGRGPGEGDGPLTGRGRGAQPCRSAARPPAARYAQGLGRLGAEAFGDNWLTRVAEPSNRGCQPAWLKARRWTKICSNRTSRPSASGCGRPARKRASASKTLRPRPEFRAATSKASKPRIGTRFRRPPTLRGSLRATHRPSASTAPRSEISYARKWAASVFPPTPPKCSRPPTRPGQCPNGSFSVQSAPSSSSSP